jgi:uncharacterized protein (TIGR02246 family)
MKRKWIFGLSLCFAPLSNSQAQVLDSADARAVAQLMAAFDETGSGRGAEAGRKRAALFSDSAVFINAFGIRREGKDSIGAFWMLIYTSGTFASSTIERLDRQQRVLGPGLILVDHVERITGQRDPATGREMPPRTAHLTLLLRRQSPGDWRIAYYRAGDVRT